MKELEKIITSRGFVFEQEFRDGNYAIYSQSLDNEIIAYELIHIRRNRAGERFGKFYPESESYPTEKMWGDYGWTFKTLSAAKERLSKYKAELQNLPSGKAVVSFSIPQG